MNLVKISSNEFVNIESVVKIQVFRYTNNNVKEVFITTQNSRFTVTGEYMVNFLDSLLEVDKNSELYNFFG